SLFIFSSRRRHTRSKRDWSSDVCSSDLFGSCCRKPLRKSFEPLPGAARKKVDNRQCPSGGYAKKMVSQPAVPPVSAVCCGISTFTPRYHPFRPFRPFRRKI